MNPREVSIIEIISFGYKKRPRPFADLIIDARGLPNPYQHPALRALNGKHPKLQEWLFAQPGTQEFIDATIQRIQLSGAQTIAIGCNAGHHRSVALAIHIGEQLGATVRHAHLKTKKKANSTAQGYGHAHQQQRKKLLHLMRDGEQCWWCGLPMFRDKTKNWDGKSLAADHSEEHGARNQQPADRLLHCDCNSRRQGGRNDHLRPAVTGRHPSEPLAPRAEENALTCGFVWK